MFVGWLVTFLSYPSSNKVVLWVANRNKEGKNNDANLQIIKTKKRSPEENRTQFKTHEFARVSWGDMLLKVYLFEKLGFHPFLKIRMESAWHASKGNRFCTVAATIAKY